MTKYSMNPLSYTVNYRMDPKPWRTQRLSLSESSLEKFNPVQGQPTLSGLYTPVVKYCKQCFLDVDVVLMDHF